jgi:hypothetical protein
MKNRMLIFALVFVTSLSSVGQLQNIVVDDGDAILKSAKNPTDSSDALESWPSSSVSETGISRQIRGWRIP